MARGFGFKRTNRMLIFYTRFRRIKEEVRDHVGHGRVWPSNTPPYYICYLKRRKSVIMSRLHHLICPCDALKTEYELIKGTRADQRRRRTREKQKNLFCFNKKSD